MPGRILIVEDETVLREGLLQLFSEEGYETRAAATLGSARRELRQNSYDLLILDLKLPDGSGLDLLSELHEPDSPLVLVVTAFPEVKTAVRALKEGAYDYINKPYDLDELQLTVERALETRQLRSEVEGCRQRQRHRLRRSVKQLVGDSERMQHLRQLIQRVASSSNTTALILGESGVGKELVAEAIHFQSDRQDGPLLKVNCAAIPANLLESELFGHEKGAFTDAKAARKGVFELAHRGTLFLDEIAEMPLELQAKLLRVLEERTLMRLGGDRPIRVDVRIVAATNRSLGDQVSEGRFRQDLYFRLNVVPLLVPPLREHREDIVQLAELFLRQLESQIPGKDCRLSEAAKSALEYYPWPGNVRELKNVIERALLLHGEGEIEPVDLALEPASVEKMPESGVETLAEVERAHILNIYRQTGCNKSQTADLLGINRLTLRRKLKDFNVD